MSAIPRKRTFGCAGLGQRRTGRIELGQGEPSGSRIRIKCRQISRVIAPVLALDYEVASRTSMEPRNRVVRVSRFGDPEALEVVEIPLPTAGRGEVRVRVLASSLNFSARPVQVVEGKGEHKLTNKIASEQQAPDQGRETLLSPHRLACEHNPVRNELKIPFASNASTTLATVEARPGAATRAK
jgi:hypothetical protein